MSGVSRLIVNHPLLAVVESASEVRVLSSAGITRPHRSYDPVRLPHGPLPTHSVEAATSDRAGLPRLPASPFQRAVPNTPMDRTGACVDCFPVHPAFPDVPAGRHPSLHFRGLLRLYSRYRPLDRSTAQGRPLSRGSDPASRPARPLVSYQINRQLSGRNPPPLVTRAFEAHRKEAN